MLMLSEELTHRWRAIWSKARCRHRGGSLCQSALYQSRCFEKAQDLTRKLTKFGGNIKFIEVPFTEIQEEIKAKAPEAYLMTLTRRFMMRITDGFGRSGALKSLSTRKSWSGGKSTIESMRLSTL